MKILGSCLQTAPIFLSKEKVIEIRFDDYEWLMYCCKQAKIAPDYIYLFSAGDFDDGIRFAATNKKNIRLVTLDEL